MKGSTGWKIGLATCALGMLGGCVTVTPLITPSGAQGFSVNCSDMNDIGECYKKAGEICGTSGYEVIDRHASSNSFWSDWTESSQTLVVRCRRPGERAAPDNVGS